MSFVPNLFIGIGERNHYFTLRENYLHVQYIAGVRHAEVRSFHHFNLSQDADEALSKAKEYAEKMAIPLYASKEKLEQELKEIRRASAEEIARREEWIRQQQADYEAKLLERAEAQRENVRNGVMPFGKHRGEPLESMDAGYLSWILNNGIEDPIWVELREWIRAHKPDAVLPVADPDKHVGEAGQRIELNVVVVKRAYYSSQYGVVYVVSMVDESGAMVVSKGRFQAEVGERLKIKGSIKDHARYNGQMQSIIQRVKVV